MLAIKNLKAKLQIMAADFFWFDSKIIKFHDIKLRIYAFWWRKNTRKSGNIREDKKRNF